MPNTNQHGNSEITDDEVIEDLKKWISMSKYISEPVFVQHILLQRILDLINRKNAEIEKNENIIRLADKTIETQNAEIERLMPFGCQVEVSKKLEKEIKSEAIKEFAERLKEELRIGFTIMDKSIRDVIDNLLKEMAGD